MQQPQFARNPFAQLMDPAALFAAIDRSDCLSRLASRICRPLDKPLIGLVDDEAHALDASSDGGPDSTLDSTLEAAAGSADDTQQSTLGRT